MMRALTKAMIATAFLVPLLEAQTLPTVKSMSRLQQEVYPVAVRSLTDARHLVTPKNYERMGFKSVEEVQSASLGQPLQVFKVWLDELKAYQLGTDPSKLFHGGDELLYPVLSVREVRSSVTIANVDGIWKRVSFGNSESTKRVTSVRDKVALEKKSGEPHYIVKVPAMNLMFLCYRSGRKLMLAPILDDPRFDFKAGVGLPATEVFSRILPAAKEQPNMPS